MAESLRVWTIRVCSECGREMHIGELNHFHGPDRGAPYFPVEEVEVVPAAAPNVLTRNEALLFALLLDEREGVSALSRSLSHWASKESGNGA